MNRGKLNKALDEISDQYIEEAAKPKRSQWRWMAPVAAVLAIVILVTAFMGPLSPGGSNPTVPPILQATIPSGPAVNLACGRIATPIYPEMAAYPNGKNHASFAAWRESQLEQYDQPEGYADGTEDFFCDSIQSFLADCIASNTVCSPLNVYMALAMLAETANGTTRQQILNLLGSDSIEALRTQAGYVWNAHYCSDDATTLTLGNSLWLADWLRYYEETVNTLATDYYASVYHDDLSDAKTHQAIRDWLDEQTGGLLSEQAQSLQFDPSTSMVLASTIYYRVKWSKGFNENRNTQDIFHTPTGDVTATYMHRTDKNDRYYWGDGFGAVRLPLEDGGFMWLILPDEGVTPAELLESRQALELALSEKSALMAYENQKNFDINLSLPKFDVTVDLDISSNLKNLGITDAFDPGTSDFSAISPDSLYVSKVNHAARVTIDEDGIVAAAYTVLLKAGYTPPPDCEEICFTLDRPFLFFITSRDNLPLFAGVVNNP